MKIGESVKIITIDTVGIVEEIRDDNFCTVRCGNLRINVCKSNLEFLEAPKNSVKNKKNKNTKNEKLLMNYTNNYTENSYSQNEQNFIDLHKKTVDEAIYELERFIDEAIFFKLDKIRVIHGKGTGTLRREIGKFLKKNKKIKTFRIGFLNEGGNGVTIIYL